MNGGELANMLTDGWAAIQGGALIELRKLEGAELSAVISDPPYASGGMSMGEKARSTRDKYTSLGEQGNPYPDFSGDALAQRAWTSFLHEIMAAARKACKPGAVCALFVDWRQLPALTDAIQWAGASAIRLPEARARCWQRCKRDTRRWASSRKPTTSPSYRSGCQVSSSELSCPTGGYRAVSFLDTSLQKQEGK